MMGWLVGLLEFNVPFQHKYVYQIRKVRGWRVILLLMGWQWHQLDHMQIICNSFQSDNYASTSPLM